MNDSFVVELKNTINNLKSEILKKQNELVSLLEQYQELTGIEFEDENND